MDYLGQEEDFFEHLARSFCDKRLLLYPQLFDVVIDVLLYSVVVPSDPKWRDDKNAEFLIERKYKIHTLYLHLQQQAYEAIVDLVLGKTSLNRKEALTVKFIEQEMISIGFKYLLEDYSENPADIELHIKDGGLADKESRCNVKSLTQLRNENPGAISNTCCYHCFKVLERHGTKKNPHYCTRNENPKCFYARKQLKKQEEREWAYVMNQQKKCAHCGKPVNYSLNTTVNNFHSRLYFCPKDNSLTKDCYEAYRKTEQRSRK